MNCFINVEDLSYTDLLQDCYQELVNSDSDLQLQLISCSDSYLTIKYYCESFDEVKDLCSSIVVILLELGLYKFSIMYEGE